MAKNALPSSLINAACHLFLISCHIAVASESSPYSWRESYYRGMQIDHFSFAADDGRNSTFDMRYLINDTWWDRDDGPIFFYPGNEGDITDFAKNTGIMWDWAPQFRAVLLFIEHRYYGESLPYGNKSRTQPYLSHLSVDQAMADYVIFLKWFKHNFTSAVSNPVIAFGGSYGAMLAAWMRAKYPHVISGALASSAPILQLPGGSAPCSSFASIVTRTFAVSGAGCEKAVKRAWPMFLDKFGTAEGRQWLNKNFRICNSSRLAAEQKINNLFYAISDAWRYMAISDYPYPTDLIAPLPGWPVREACKYLTDPSGKDHNDTFLLNVRKAVMIFYNYTGETDCLELGASKAGNFDLTVWNFQMCTELIFRRCQVPSDMFPPYMWGEDWYSRACHQLYGVWPRFNWLTMNYGVELLKSATNIIFSSGDLDPWSGGSVTQKSLEGADPSLVVISIPNAAHHYDLRASDPLDTPEVIEARNRMKVIVKGWIEAASQRRAAPAASHALAVRASTKGVKIEYERL